MFYKLSAVLATHDLQAKFKDCTRILGHPVLFPAVSAKVGFPNKCNTENNTKAIIAVNADI